MIANERQYRITRSRLAQFERALAQADEGGSPLSPRLRNAMRDGIQSQIEDFRSEITAYEALRNGQISVLEHDSLDQLPAALIQARTAAGLTQEELAKRLGKTKQQIQRYERTRYQGASLATIQAVADALGVTIHERIELPMNRAAGQQGNGPVEPSKR